MADRAEDPGSGHGIHSAVLAASVANAGAALESRVPNVGRCWSHGWNAASGSGAVESWAAGAQERFRRCRTSTQAFGGTGADPEFCARCRTASLAHCSAPEVPIDVRPGAVAEPVGVRAGRSTPQVV